MSFIRKKLMLISVLAFSVLLFSGCDFKAMFGDEDESVSDATSKASNQLNGNYFLLEVHLKDGSFDLIQDLNFDGKGTLSYDTCDIIDEDDCSGSINYLVSNGVFTVSSSEANLGYASADGSFMVHTDADGKLRFAVELDSVAPGTSVEGVYQGVGFFNGSDSDSTGNDMRLEAHDITNLTFENGVFDLTIGEGQESCSVAGNYSFKDDSNGEFKIDITNDGCDDGDSTEIVGAVS